MNDIPNSNDDGDNARLLAQARPGDNAEPLSVSALSASLKRTVEDRFGYVRVRGELSGAKRVASGHFYFGLKDDNAKLDGVMWKGNVGRLPFAPEDGLEVIATGKLTTYAGRSSYQIIADRLELAGEGALMLLFEKLKARLSAEGLFDPAHKRAIPFMPRTIGVVTSPTGAVIRDILHRLADRYPTRVIIWPVLVQGDGAAAQIAAAIDGFSSLSEGGDIPRPDLVIVARGGGSIEDLWAFNEESVVRAVAGCSIPIISAVGHETDTTLCDFAADLRAPTPTAAAEMAVPVRRDLLDRLGQLDSRMNRAVQRMIAQATERLDARARLLPRLGELANPQQQRADELGERLLRGHERQIAKASLAFARPASVLGPRMLERLIADKAARLDGARFGPAPILRGLVDRQAKLDTLARLSESFHPETPLKRGFARVTDAQGKTISNSNTARAAGHVSLRFADGAVGAMITDTNPQRPSVKTKKPNQSGDKAADQANLFGE